MESRKRDAVWVAAAGLLLLFLLAEVQVWQGRAALRDVKNTLTDRCEQRQKNDRDTAADLQARIDLYAAMIEIETANRFVDEQVRAKRVKAYTNAQTQAQVRLTGLPAPVNCRAVYAEGR